MTARPNLPFHLKVRVRSNRPTTQAIDGRLGYVAGITETTDDKGRFQYGIFIYDLARVWMCSENECESTGELDAEAVRRSEDQRRRLSQGSATPEDGL